MKDSVLVHLATTYTIIFYQNIGHILVSIKRNKSGNPKRSYLTSMGLVETYETIVKSWM